MDQPTFADLEYETAYEARRATGYNFSAQSDRHDEPPLGTSSL